MEEHFGAEKAFVADVHLNQVVVERFVHQSTELGALSERAVFPLFLLVELLKLLLHVNAAVAKALLDCLGNFHAVTIGDLLSTVLQLLQDKLGDVSASQRQRFDATGNHIGVTNWEHVRNAITCVDDCAGHIGAKIRFAVRVS